jgi:hypothetical protein
MSLPYVGTITIKDGLPECPRCLKSMSFVGTEKQPSGNEMPVWRCAECGAEFPPAEARAASQAEPGGTHRPRHKLIVGIVIVIIAAIAAAWALGLLS